MNIFSYGSYKKALREILLDRKSRVDPHCTFQAMASFCGVQKTYLSKVLNSSGHLSEDQLYLAGTFLHLNESESEYLQLLLAFERCRVDERRLKLKARIEAEQTSQLKTEKSLSADTFTHRDGNYSAFYLDPTLQLILVFLTVERYSSSPDKICEKLRLSKEHVWSALKSLQTLGFINSKNEKIRVIKDSMHLSTNSPLYPAYKILTRLHLLDRIQKPSFDDYNFSLVFSADEETQTLIRVQFLKFLEHIEKTVKKAPSKEIFQMNFDLLAWG